MVEELKILETGGTIFSGGVHYVIPRYQRAYAWQDKEIVQLIDDIADFDSTGYYYIGSLVVSKVNGRDNTFEVVDGQQRLTTLFLLLNYLVFKDGLAAGLVEQRLSFDCRDNSNYTLSCIQELMQEKLSFESEDRIEHSIRNGVKAIKQKFENDGIEINKFIERLQRVVLFRIEVPQNTDLNRYFEIMNTRGEQLEQHDILKAQLMGSIGCREEQELFSEIWDACSDMTGYVQMHFSPAIRETLFGNKWDSLQETELGKIDFNSGNKERGNYSIKDIIKNDFKVDNVDGTLDDGTHLRFESIIDFPDFLLHSLRVFVKKERINVELGSLLDDKKLLDDFNRVMNSEEFKEKKKLFAESFIIHLLKTRYLFDKYIVKREYTGDDNDGKWSLKELKQAGSYNRKTAYYVNTALKTAGEWCSTFEPRNKESLMIQSALRVSYTSPKVMHWITELLLWVLDDSNTPAELTTAAERIAARATKENFLDKKDYELGVKTPHIVFNFLDYLLWKKDKISYADFEFEFRNSVEHWYPQNPSDGSFSEWEEVDTFGNLCIISRNVNSKFSNLSPKSKMQSYDKLVEKGSIKLRIMGELIKGCSNDDWATGGKCKEHQEAMIETLENAIDNLVPDNDVV